MLVDSTHDYAVLEAGDTVYYYGYEVTKKEKDDVLWCFQVTKNNEVLCTLTEHEIEDMCDSYFSDCKDYLLAGIGIYLGESNEV